MTDVAKLLLLGFIGLTETFLLHFQFSLLMKRNNCRNKHCYYLMLALYCLCTVFDAAHNFSVFFVFLIAYLLIAITAYVFYDGTIATKLSDSFVFLSVNYAATIYATVLVYKFTDALEFPRNLSQNFLSQVILTLLCMAALLLLYQFGKRMNTKFFPNFIVSFLIPLLICILLLTQFYLNQNSCEADLEMKNHLIVGTLLLLTGWMLYSLTVVNNLLTVSLQHSATLDQMLSMQEKYYLDLQKHQHELRLINHDIKNHTATMAQLIKTQQYNALGEYIMGLKNSINSITAPVTNCDNLLINSLLNDKLGVLKEEGVDLQLCVMVPAVLRINNVDLCILLGNLLDNAVEACVAMEAEEPRYIRVDIRSRGPFLVVEIANSYNNVINIKDSEYLTTKRVRLLHGMGLTNVRRVVNKYDGRFEINHENGEFCVRAILTYPFE